MLEALFFFVSAGSIMNADAKSKLSTYRNRLEELRGFL